jgi:hypothetical protein
MNSPQYCAKYHLILREYFAGTMPASAISNHRQSCETCGLVWAYESKLAEAQQDTPAFVRRIDLDLKLRERH